MNIVDVLEQAHGGRGLEAIGNQFGLDEAQTRAALNELAPMVAAGVRRNTRQDDGVVSLLEALGGGRHERYVEDPRAVRYDEVREDGNAILGHLFGSKNVSREVAMQAAGSSGVGSAILKKMLPVIASMVLGAIFKRMTGGGNRRPAPAPQPAPRQGRGGGLDDLLRDILGGGMGGGTARRRGGYNGDALERGRRQLDDIIGGPPRTGSGNDADDLLESVNRRLGY